MCSATKHMLYYVKIHLVIDTIPPSHSYRLCLQGMSSVV